MSWIGLDLGGTKVYGVVVDHGEIKEHAKRKTPPSGEPDAVVEIMAQVIEDLGGTHKVKGIGVGAPGLIDRKAGVLKRAPNLPGWTDDFPLGPALAKAARTDAPVVLANDVEAGMVGEHRLGAARGRNEVLALWLGTGVGGGLVLGGKAHRGARGMAGEVGHVVVKPGGRRCGCGGAGHVEAYAGRASMEREARARAAAGRSTMLVDLAGQERMRSSVFGRAYEAGDPVALELMAEAVEACAALVAAMNTVLDLELVVLGGGMGERLGEALAPKIEEQARWLMFVPDSPIRIAATELGDAAGAAGAALVAADAG